LEKVSIIGNVSDIGTEVKRCVDLVGGYSINKSDLVVIKPNICNVKNPENMVITDFQVIRAVVNQVKELGNEVIMVESDNISGTAEKRAKGSGFLDLCDELDVEFLNLSHDDYEEFPVSNTLLRLPRTVLDADYFINLPKIKTCAHTLVTLAIKNLYGVFQRRRKGRLHKHLDEILPFLAEKIQSDLIIVDGLTCMEGNGPVIGNPVRLNLLAAGTNAVAVDSICSRLMGYDPASISHIALSSKNGVGPIALDQIEVLNDDWASLGHYFEPPYSLKATLKSWKAIREVYFTG
jgi:uncharacterized protein (DUF362 family)